VARKLKTYRTKRIRTEEETELDTTIPEGLLDHSGESPNRVYMPRKIGRRRPEEERGYKPTVI
jgi:hypothetical protein